MIPIQVLVKGRVPKINRATSGMRQLASREVAVATRQAQLAPPGDLAHRLGLTFLAALAYARTRPRG